MASKRKNIWEKNYSRFLRSLVVQSSLSAIERPGIETQRRGGRESFLQRNFNLKIFQYSQ